MIDKHCKKHNHTKTPLRKQTVTKGLLAIHVRRLANLSFELSMDKVQDHLSCLD